MSTFTTTPLYHGGIADLLRAWSAASTLWLFPEHQAPIHGKNILAALQPILSTQRLDGRLGYVSCVPYVLQMMAEEPELLGCLKEMEIVGVGGAALPTELGDRLVDGGVSLVSRFGSAECGCMIFLPS